MNVGHAPANDMQDLVRSQRALIGALPGDTVWAVSAECSRHRHRRRGQRGVLSHNGAFLCFESWDGSVIFRVPLDGQHVKRRFRHRVRVVDHGTKWLLSDPQDLRLVMSTSPGLPRRVVDHGGRFMGLFEQIR